MSPVCSPYFGGALGCGGELHEHVVGKVVGANDLVKLGEAFDDLKKVELLDERDQMREREAESAAEQAELDGIALLRARGIAPA